MLVFALKIYVFGVVLLFIFEFWLLITVNQITYGTLQSLQYSYNELSAKENWRV